MNKWLTRHELGWFDVGCFGIIAFLLFLAFPAYLEGHAQAARDRAVLAPFER